MQHHPVTLQRMPTGTHDLGDTLIERIAKGNMGDDAALEEGKGPHALRAIDDLVRHDEIPRLDLLLQGAHGREGDHRPDTDLA